MRIGDKIFEIICFSGYRAYLHRQIEYKQPLVLLWQ